MRRATGILLSIVVTLSLALSACGGGDDGPKLAKHESLRFVPSDASAIVTLRSDLFASDPALKELLEDVLSGEGGFLGDQLPIDGDSLRALLNLGPKFMTIFFVGPREAGPPTLDSNGNPVEEGGPASGLLIEGSFNKALLVPLIGAALGAKPAMTTYKGVEVFTLAFKGRSLSIAFMSGSLLAVASPQTIVSIIDIKDGTMSVLQGKRLRELDRSDDDFVKLSVGPIGEALRGQKMDSGSMMGSALSTIENVSLGIKKSGDDFLLHAKVEMASFQDAQKMKKAVHGLRDILDFAAGGTDVARLLTKIEDGARGRDYVISIRYSYEDIEKLQDGLKSAGSRLMGDEE